VPQSAQRVDLFLMFFGARRYCPFATFLPSLEEERGEIATGEYSDNLDRLESLICGAIATNLSLSKWFLLGKEMSRGSWAYTVIGEPLSDNPKWTWTDEKQLQQLLHDLGIKLEQVFPEIENRTGRSGLMTYATSKFSHYQQIERGLVNLCQAAGGSPDKQNASVLAELQVVGRPSAGVKWQPGYLGLQFDFQQFCVKREGRDPIQLSRLLWDLLLVLEQAKTSFASRGKVETAWTENKRRVPKNPASVTSTIDALEDKLAPLCIGIQNKRDRGWKLIEITAAPVT